MILRRVSPVLQETSSECSLACLSMVSAFFGRDLPLQHLRSMFPNISRGVSLREMLETAPKVGISLRPLKVPLKRLNELTPPAILHWDFNHFVVLEKVSNRKITILDPARGRIKLEQSELEIHYTGVAIEATADETWDAGESFNNEAEKPPTLGAEFYHSAIFKVSMVSTFVLLFSLIAPLVVQVIVDGVIVRNDRELLAIVAVLFLAVHVFSSISEYVQNTTIAKLTARTRDKVTAAFLTRLISHQWNYFSERGLAVFVAQYTSLVRVVNTYVATLGQLITNAGFSLIVLIFLFLIDGMISVVVAATSLLVFIVRFVAVGKFRALEDKVISTSSAEESYFVETIRGITSVKINGLENIRSSNGLNKTISSINSAYDLALFSSRFALFNRVIKSVEVIVVLVLLANAVLDGVMTIGVMYLFYSYRQFLDARLTASIAGYGELLNLDVHANRLRDVMALSMKPQNIFDIRIALEGAIECSSLFYSVDSGRSKVIDNFSCKLEPGRFAMVSGESGAGKSSLLKIMLGLIRQDSGTVRIGDIPCEHNTNALIKNNCGVVLQEDSLFRGSIMQNVGLFYTEVNLDRVVECCKLACVHEDVLALPMGYNSEIGDLGANISTGQKQRLLIARALYKDPAILFLDEATANLNDELEKKILANLKSLNKSVVFASHSSNVRAIADVVWDLPHLQKMSAVK